jgi:hypothetical protein
MEALRYPVDVIVERIPLANRWAAARWAPCAVIALPEGSPTASADATSATREPAAIGEPAASDDTRVRFRFAGFAVELHPAESEGYWLNLSATNPKAFVRYRAAEEGDLSGGEGIVPLAVTLSYHEAARWMDGGAEVDAVELPAVLHADLSAFVAAHYRPEPRRKSRRNPLYEEHGDPPRRTPR